MTFLSPRHMAALAAAAVVALAGCSGSDSSGGSSPGPEALRAEQISLQLESSIDQDNTTAFSEQLDARWAEISSSADLSNLSTSSTITSSDGSVVISGGGVTCTVSVVNEPPAVDRNCVDG